jgi:hypothetical protein
MGMVQVPIMQVIDVTVVLNPRVTAGLAVRMGMRAMLIAVWHDQILRARVPNFEASKVSYSRIRAM